MTIPIVNAPGLSLAASPGGRAASAEELRKVGRHEVSEGFTVDDLVDSGLQGVVPYVLGGAGPSIAAHELGHANMARALYQGANPTVAVHPFQGGVTTYTPGPLTDLGMKYGESGSAALVAGAGTLVDATSSAINFAVGYRIRKNHPIIGHALMGYAGYTMANSICYAGTALMGSLPELARQGNDFATLATTIGLPPVAAMAILGALLPAEYLVLRGLEKAGI